MQKLESPRVHLANSGYADSLIESIDGASENVMLETMALDHLGKMDTVLDATMAARKRGVTVLIMYDTFSHFEMTTSPKKARQHRTLRDRLAELDDAGVDLYELGKIGRNPFAERSHAKVAIADEKVYLGGGINLTGESFETNDYMIEFDNKSMADALRISLPTKALGRSGDEVLYSDATNELLLDAGQPGASLIYQRTCQLARTADKAYYVSKLAPDGELLTILDGKTEYWYNPLSSARGFDKLAILIDRLKSNTPNNYRGDRMLHAKACVFEMPDGHKEAITGSHNFNSRGVAFGTQELALHTKDQDLCDQLVDFAKGLS